MTSDLSLFGVFLNGGLVTALLALLIHIPVRTLFRWTGAYRLFWHPALVNVATFVLLWGAFSYSLASLPAWMTALLG